MSRHGYEAARRELELARDAIRVAKEKRNANLTARLFEFTQVVLNAPLVASALADLLRIRPQDFDEVRGSWRQLHIAPMVVDLTNVARLFEKVRAAAANLSPDPDDPMPRILTQDVWGDNLGAVIPKLASHDDVASLSLEQLGKLASNGFGMIRNWIDLVSNRVVRDRGRIAATLAHSLEQDIAQLKSLMDRLGQLIANATSDQDHFSSFLNAYSLHPAVDRLREFNRRAHLAMRPAAMLPLARLNSDTVLGDVDFLADQLLAQLALGPSRWSVLDRLQTYFTHFAYDELATKLENEERAAKVRSGKAQREEILQEEVDRFIFMEGMYPITHCEASGGKLDTLIELYNDANRRRHRPLLLELKQALNLLHSEEITVEAVAAAINDGLDQAELYRKHVRTNTRWSDVDPFVVVFHNCTERIDDDESRNVVLVSLSELTPSGSRRRRRRFTSSTG